MTIDLQGAAEAIGMGDRPFFSAKANHEELPNHRASNAAGHQTCFSARRRFQAKQRKERADKRSGKEGKQAEAFYPTHFYLPPRKNLPFLKLQAGVCI
jgi:hypothetical protein